MSASQTTGQIKSRRSSDFGSLGAPNASVTGHISATYEGDGPWIKTTLTLKDVVVTTGNTTGASFGSTKLYDFPEGRIAILSNIAYFTEIDWAGSDIAVGGSGDYSLGSTATADATLSSTDVDMLPSTAMLDPFVAGVGRSNAGSALAALAQFDGTTTAVDMNLNAIIDDADVSDGAASDDVRFTGTIEFVWCNIGDYTTS